MYSFLTFCIFDSIFFSYVKRFLIEKRIFYNSYSIPVFCLGGNKFGLWSPELNHSLISQQAVRMVRVSFLYDSFSLSWLGGEIDSWDSNMSKFQTSQISNVNTLQHVAFRELKEKKTKQNKKHGKGNWSMNVAESLTSLKIWWAVQWPAGCGGALKFFFIPITSSICVRREVKSQMIDHFSIASLHLSKYEFQTDFLERRGYKNTKINKQTNKQTIKQIKTWQRYNP